MPKQPAPHARWFRKWAPQLCMRRQVQILDGHPASSSSNKSIDRDRELVGSPTHHPGCPASDSPFQRSRSTDVVLVQTREEVVGNAGRYPVSRLTWIQNASDSIRPLPELPASHTTGWEAF